MDDAVLPLKLSVQVCFAPSPVAAVVMIDLLVAPGTTLADSITQSGIVARMAGLDPLQCKSGIWSKLRPAQTVLRDRDRVEIYRPLIADPKEARRRRADKKVSTQR